MRVLLDNNVARSLAPHLVGHEVKHCRELGWQELSNGKLVALASQSFDVLITVDKNMRFQTSLTGINLAVLVLDAKNNTRDEMMKFIPAIERALPSLVPGEFCVLGIEN